MSAWRLIDEITKSRHNHTAACRYYFHNVSGPPPPLPTDTDAAEPAFVIPRLKELLRVEGGRNGSQPVRGLTLAGLEFRDAAPTYLEPHGQPSGGDWALQRTAAVFVQGSEGLRIESCRFVRLDGNALMLSAYNRNATIQKNEFAWTGTPTALVTLH